MVSNTVVDQREELENPAVRSLSRICPNLSQKILKDEC
jgi:hypothetical protein